MSTIFSIMAIFAFIICLFLASLKIVDLVFVTRQKFKPNHLKLSYTALSLLLWFFLSAFTTVFTAYFFFQAPRTWLNNTQKAIADIVIEPQDCQQLTNTIYTVENQIYKLENHRYIEEVSPIFTIKLDYERGSQKLNSAAEKYLNLALAETSRHYSQQIAEKLQEKAKLFQERAEIIANNKGAKQISTLLDKMDRVTEQRKNLVGIVKKQCSS